jgi:hypothetical protein
MIAAGLITAPCSEYGLAYLSKVPALQRLFSFFGRRKEHDDGVDRSDAFDAASGRAARLKPIPVLIVRGPLAL